MEKNNHRQTHKIDAEGRVLGRLATEIAILLRGKNKVNFEPQVDRGDVVELRNADKIKFTGNKPDTKIYYRHTNYPGGLKETKLSKLFAENPEEVIKKAVWNMLPKNKLRSRFIKRLKFIK